MNIELIQAELKRLSSLVSAWNSGESVSAIERDLALEKLAKLYEMVRFDLCCESEEGATESAVEETPAPVIPPVMPEAEIADESDEEDEKEVEVELIFADDDDEEETFADEQEDEEAEVEAEAEPMVIPAVDIEAEPVFEPTPEPVVEPIAEPVVEPIAEPVVEPAPVVTPEPAPAPVVESEMVVAPEPEPMPEPIAEPVVESAPVVETVPVAAPEPEPIVESAPVAEPEPVYTQEPTPEPQPIVEPQPQRPVERPRKPSMESLFGAEEIQRKPRSKHQRMMAIYGDPQPKQEKVVDISKIFEMEDEEFELTSTPVHRTESVAPSTVNDLSANKTTLADTIAPATTTLADTIVAPAPLAEEITMARTTSLRKAIGLNDKFLMTRDLFDGDSEAFEEAISALDECETFDDCMIHIVENYEWNPDSEGAKFIMQLLERKHS